MAIFASKLYIQSNTYTIAHQTWPELFACGTDLCRLWWLKSKSPRKILSEVGGGSAVLTSSWTSPGDLSSLISSMLFLASHLHHVSRVLPPPFVSGWKKDSRYVWKTIKELGVENNLSKLLRNQAAQKPITLIFTKHCFSTFQYETLFRDSESLKQGI